MLKKSSARGGAMDKKPITILVVEDEEDARILYQECLQDAGYQVLLSENGLEALAELRDEKVDLMMTDLKMPDMSALEMLPLVRKDHPQLPIIVVSAYYRTLQDDFQARGYNIQAFFNKPVNFAILLDKIKELVGAPPKPPQQK
jgi:CheY-like chemotaxis protein